MNFVLIMILMINTPTGTNDVTIEVNGFKTEAQCNREIARMRFSKLKSGNDVDIVFDHCVRTR